MPCHYYPVILVVILHVGHNVLFNGVLIVENVCGIYNLYKTPEVGFNNSLIYNKITLIMK